MRLDRTLAELFHFVDKEVGLEHVLSVLSADHGMADKPEYATEQGREAGRIYSDEVLSLARELSEKSFGSQELVKDFYRPYIYLDTALVEQKKLDARTVAKVIAEGVERMPGIARAVSQHEPQEFSGNTQSNAVLHNHHKQRSGDIYVYQEPYWYLFDRGAIGVMHGSPWSYDSHVPMIFAGPGIQASQITRLVHPVDVAPTLAGYLGISPPAGAEGDILPEALPAAVAD